MKGLLLGMFLLGSFSVIGSEKILDNTLITLINSGLECSNQGVDTSLGCIGNTSSCTMETTFECVDDEGVTKATVVETERAKHEGNYLVAKEVLKVETTFDN